MASGYSSMVATSVKRSSTLDIYRPVRGTDFASPSMETDDSSATPAHDQVDWTDTRAEKKPGKKTRKLVAIRCPDCEAEGVESKRYRCASHIAYKINWGSFSGRCTKHQGRSGHWAKELKSPPYATAA